MFHTTPGPTVSVDLSTESSVRPPIDLTARRAPHEVVIVSATDLIDAQNQRARLRAERAEAGVDPDAVSVLLEVFVHLAVDGRTARREVGTSGVGAGMLYVGTAAGLAGLIADAKAADVADGIVVRPILRSESALRAVAVRIVDGVMPWLAERGVESDPSAEDELLRHVGAARRTLAS